MCTGELRDWLAANHAEAMELWVGYHKAGTGVPSVTWPESVDEALCCGWIDGVRVSVDAARYAIRFAPRRSGSVWSAINIRRMEELIAAGRAHPSGVAAFNARRENRSGIYSYEQRTADLPDPYATEFQADQTAWEFFQSCPPSYRKAAIWWVVSAKKEETRLKRLATLIEDSAAGRLIAPLRRKAPG